MPFYGGDDYTSPHHLQQPNTNGSLKFGDFRPKTEEHENLAVQDDDLLNQDEDGNTTFYDAWDQNESDMSEDDSPSEVPFDEYRRKKICVDLPLSTLVSPKSLYHKFTPPAPPTRERKALEALMEELERQGGTAGQDFIEFDLDNFAFYVSSKLYPNEMRPLHHFATKKAHDTFYFDGVVSLGYLKFYLTRVEAVELPIGNYGVSEHTVGDQIWVRSWRNAKQEVYYKFKKPSTEYARFHNPFLWVADLAKHTVDFTSHMIDRQQQLGIASFKNHFIQWLVGVHRNSAAFRQWREQHPSDDFRTAIMANIDFIWKEMNGVLDSRKVRSLQMFRETMQFNHWKVDRVLAPVVIREGGDARPVTIVTPYIMECFGHMVIGKVLRVGGQAQHLPIPVKKDQDGQVVVRPLIAITAAWPKKNSGRRSEHNIFLRKEAVNSIKVGDTISTPRDPEDATDTKWKSMAAKDGVEDDRWFGLVQKVHVSPKDGSRSFDVTWFYRPVETPCCMMKYPWPNELFLSDHCTCEDGVHARIKGTDILATHAVDWFGDPPRPSGDEFFVRQTYIVEKRRWMTLNRSHLRCSHEVPKLGFKVGQTILARRSEPDDNFSDVYEVQKIFKQEGKPFVRLRKLLRRKAVDADAPNAPPNELVYTDQTKVVKPDKVVAKCLVRFFRPDTPIPVPYNQGGIGNLFYITTRLEVSGEGLQQCLPFDGEFPETLRQGFDPTKGVGSKLRGLDLFCGSGNFGRGLEESGIVDMRWANDIWDRAIHTYMANTPSPETTHPFLGSVDDLLQLAMEGKYAENIPRPGDVDFILGGSPCQGFSLLTAEKTTLKQVKNQSMVASFASFIDFYRPKYGVLENVREIISARHNQKEDVLSQLFCALVGMGYQTQLIMGDAWSHGAPQHRIRVFLYFAAPGLSLPEAPLASHSHLPITKNQSLGKMANGEPFLRRIFGPTAFKYVSAAESTADLPPIYDGMVDTCVPFPDHRLSHGVSYGRRREYQLIPTHPAGMSFVKAWSQGRGVMTPAEREVFPKEGSARVLPNSTGWARVHPNIAFPTVTTASNPTDARLSACLHWFESRPLTIMEVRRAQGFPDDEVLLGLLADQWKLVGNSVARQMAIAVGLKFREAWLGSLEDGAGSGRTGLDGVSSGFSTPRFDMSTGRRSNTPHSRLQSVSREVSEVEMANVENGVSRVSVSATPMTALSRESTATAESGRTTRGKKRAASSAVDASSLRGKIQRR